MEQRLHQHLNKLGFRLTEPRRAVFAALGGHEPLTMNQLVTACPAIDRSSIYRTVELFEKLGIIQRLQIGWKYKLELAEAYSHHHHHLTCLRCGQVVSFEESPRLSQELAQIARRYGFTMQDHQLEIQGLCGHCRPA